MPQREEDFIRLDPVTPIGLGPGRSGRTPAARRRSPMARRALLRRRLAMKRKMKKPTFYSPALGSISDRLREEEIL